LPDRGSTDPSSFAEVDADESLVGDSPFCGRGFGNLSAPLDWSLASAVVCGDGELTPEDEIDEAL
jgi:hypothetical protein